MNVTYFPHDSNARADIKLARLLSRHGLLGYGLFWAIVEDLYKEQKPLELDFEFLSWYYREDRELVRSVIMDFDLFETTSDTFFSKGVNERLEKIREKSDKAKASSRARWSKDADGMRTHNGRNAIKEKKSKVKGKEIKEKEKGIIPPSVDEVVAYFEEKGYEGRVGRIAHEHYSTNDWKDAHDNPVRNWKNKMNQVWFRPEHLAKPSEDSYISQITKNLDK